MKLIPNYSYEFNCILNEDFNENQQIQNFASLLSDKDRFLILLPFLEVNSSLIEKHLGYSLLKEYNFYIVRAEKFKSFSKPITIEYSILPQEMILFLFKEIVKISIVDRFPDELLREEYINSFIDFICINGDWGEIDITKYTKILHEISKENYLDYNLSEVNFNKKTMKEYLSELYS